MIKLFKFLILYSLFDLNDSCGSKKQYLKKDQKPIDSTGSLTFAEKILGIGVKLEQYDNVGYRDKRGQAGSGSDLSCNLNSDCCWRNSDHPYDTMEFVKATGVSDSISFERFFKTSEKPSESYLVTMAMAGASPDEKADFQSCGISCTSDSIRVGVRKWTTDNVMLKICEVKQSDPSNYIHCEQINGPNGQVASVYLPPARDIYVRYANLWNGSRKSYCQWDWPLQSTHYFLWDERPSDKKNLCRREQGLYVHMEEAAEQITYPMNQILQLRLGQLGTVVLEENHYSFQLAIVAQNFVSKNGSGVIFSDITVDYAQCEEITSQVMSSTTEAIVTSSIVSTEAAEKDDSAECQRLKCDFESGLCNYHLGQGPQTPQDKGKLVPFTQQGTGTYGNKATGVVESPDKTHYAAVYLDQHDRGYLEVEANFDKERTVAFQEYKATVGIQLQVCCDTLSNCNYTSGASVNIMDFRQWYKGVATCPAGTNKLIFYAENSNGNQGGVGLDNIIVVQDRTSDVQLC